MTKLRGFPYLVNCRLVDPSNDCMNRFTRGVLRYVYSSDNRKCPKVPFLFSFRALYDENSSFYTTRTIYHIKLTDLSK